MNLRSVCVTDNHLVNFFIFLIHTLARSHARTHAHTRTHTHARTHAHTLAHSLARLLTLTRLHTYTRIHIRNRNTLLTIKKKQKILVNSKHLLRFKYCLKQNEQAL